MRRRSKVSAEAEVVLGCAEVCAEEIVGTLFGTFFGTFFDMFFSQVSAGGVPADEKCAKPKSVGD